LSSHAVKAARDSAMTACIPNLSADPSL
jgi:hypothetical protein